MNEKNNTAGSPPSVNITGDSNHATRALPASDQELVYRLKAAIDARGRYSFRLDDMAAGLSVGNGVSHVEARKNIEERFKTHLGQSPQEYLDRHYEQRRQNEQEREPGRGRGR
jgi:hypothetical protein